MSKTAKSISSPADVRQTYLKHESAILATGQLFYLIALGLLLASGTGVMLRNWHGMLSWRDTLWVGGVFAGLGVLYAAVGYGLRTLATWSRFGAGGLALLCLTSLIIDTLSHNPVVLSLALLRVFALPVGIILTGYAAYLALTKKGVFVLSGEYRQVVADTAKVDYVFSKLFLGMGIILVMVQSLRVLMIFTGQIG